MLVPLGRAPRGNSGIPPAVLYPKDVSRIQEPTTAADEMVTRDPYWAEIVCDNSTGAGSGHAHGILRWAARDLHTPPSRYHSPRILHHPEHKVNTPRLLLETA